MAGKIELHYGPDFSALTDEFLQKHPEVVTRTGSTLYLVQDDLRVQQLKRQWILSKEEKIALDLPFLTYYGFISSLISLLNIPGRAISYVERMLILKSLLMRKQPEMQFFTQTNGFVPDEVVGNLVTFFDAVRLQAADDEISKNISPRLALSTTDKLQQDLKLLFPAYQSQISSHHLDEAAILHQIIIRLKPDFLNTCYPALDAVVFEDVSHFKAWHFRLIEKLKASGFNIFLLLPYGRNLEIFSHKNSLFSRIRHMADHLEGYREGKKLCESLFQIKILDLQLAPKIRIVPAASRLKEVEELASEIKKQAVQSGWRCGEVAVTGPRLESYQELLHTVFQRYGLPYSDQLKKPVRYSTALKYLELLLRLVLEEYTLSTVQQILLSPFLKFRAQLAGVNVPALLSQFRVRSGKEALREYLAAVVRQESSVSGGEGVYSSRTAYRQLDICLQDLIKEVEFFESHHRPREIYQKLVQLITGHQMVEKLLSPHHPGHVRWKSENVKSLGHFLELLYFWQDYETRTSPTARWDLSRFFNIFLMITRNLSVAAKTPFSFGIQIVPFTHILQGRYRVVFIVGMEEGTIPGENRGMFIHPRHIPSNLRDFTPHDQLYREREFFLQLLQHPADWVQFSYPRFHQDKPVLPSPFLRELERISSSTRERPAGNPQLSPSGMLEQLLDYSRLKGIEQLDPKMLPDPLKAVLPSEIFDRVNYRCRIIRHREREPKLTAWEGILSGDPVAASWFKVRYSGVSFSPTQLEHFAHCPMRYFFERILKLEPFEERDAFLTPAERGMLVHQILFHFYQDITPGQRDLEILKLMAEKALDAIPLAFGLGKELEKEFYLGNDQVTGLLPAFWEYEQAIASRYSTVPRHFELSFGNFPDSGNPADALSSAQPFVYRYQDEIFQFRGKVDRVEVGDNGALLVVDYKTGTAPSLLEMWNGERLQLPVYLKAACSLLRQKYPELTMAGAAFYTLRKPHEIEKKIAFKDQKTEIGDVDIPKNAQFPNEKYSEGRDPVSMEDFIERVFQFAVHYIRQIRQASFPHTTDLKKCRDWNGNYCEYLAICRVNRHKIFLLRNQQDSP